LVARHLHQRLRAHRMGTSVVEDREVNRGRTKRFNRG
jgi:hypothetical protein